MGVSVLYPENNFIKKPLREFAGAFSLELGKSLTESWQERMISACTDAPKASAMQNSVWDSLALFIALSPALIQLFGFSGPPTKGWRMYGTVGVSAPYGHFEVFSSEETQRLVSIAETLEISRLRYLQSYQPAGTLLIRFDDSGQYAQTTGRLCQSLEPDQQLRFSGKAAHASHWASVSIHHDQLLSRTSWSIRSGIDWILK